MKRSVMAEVQVTFKAVVGDEDLAMLERAHRARINIEVRIHLLHGDFVATGLEQCAKRGSGNALSE